MNIQQDYIERVNPDLMTSLIRESVPSLDDINFQFLEVNYGYCKSILPLNLKSSNQHGTHQALLLGMGGDYTGGLAFATLILHEPILGVHKVTSKKGMSLWLLKSEMEYLKPSTDDVIIEATIPESLGKDLHQRYLSSKTIILDVEVGFKNLQNEDIAKGKFRYYCKKKTSLTKTIPGKRINAMYEHLLKTSAKLIAQLRALESEKSTPLFIDRISGKVAGKQGKVISDRFIKLLPELQNMVAARTFHLDKKLEEYSKRIENIVFVGVGLDFRMYRNASFFRNKTIYELDLAEMMEERIKWEDRLNMNTIDGMRTIKIHTNFLLDNLCEKLICNGLDPKEPTFFIYEGCSMYFAQEENKKILVEISQLLSHNEGSLLWMDMVDSKALNTIDPPMGLKSFLSNMAKLGEPFVFGFDNNYTLLNEAKLNIIQKSSTTDCLSVESSEVYSLYSFALLQYSFS